MSFLTGFGLFAVTAMLVCYAMERRSSWWVLGFGLSCWLGSAHGFLQGAWPFGIVEAIWRFRSRTMDCAAAELIGRPRQASRLALAPGW